MNKYIVEIEMTIAKMHNVSQVQGVHFKTQPDCLTLPLRAVQ